MIRLLGNWLINGVAVLAAAYLLPSVTVDSFWIALIVALVLGIINVTLKPVLKIFALPINILSLGLFTIVINAVLILFADVLVDGFFVEGFVAALLFSIILGVINAILSIFK